MTSNIGTSFQMLRNMNNQANSKNGMRVQTNLNNLTSDFDLCSPLNNNHNKVLINLDANNNTIESFQNPGAAMNALDCSTLSTHSINDTGTNNAKSSTRGVSKGNLQISEAGLNDGRKA